MCERYCRISLYIALCLQKKKGKKAAASTIDAVQDGAITAVSADNAADPVVLVKKSADSPAVLVSSNGDTEPVSLEQTASGKHLPPVVTLVSFSDVTKPCLHL